MPRPMEDGIDYFPLNVNFFADDKVKLIRSEFGAKGLMILIYLFCEIYRGEGYYKIWNEESCMLVSDGASCGCTPEFTSQVVQRCVKRSLFDDKLFNVHRILTSKGIQRRYVRACAARDEIRIRQEYWLLDVNSKKDVPPATLKKITFVSETSEKTPVILKKTPVSSENNPQSKVKESKVKKKRESTAACAAAPSLDEVKGFFKGRPGDPERFWHYHEATGWIVHGEPVTNWRALAENWIRNERPKADPEPVHTPSYDLDEYEKYDIFSRQESKEKSK